MLSSQNFESVLNQLLEFLENEQLQDQGAHLHNHNSDLETWDKLKLLKGLLCVRSSQKALPSNILDDIELVLQHDLSHHVLTPSSSIPIARIYPSDPLASSADQVRFHVWKGDITKLTETTAIVNAANSQLLGCFQPQHICIDNAIHAAAGPRLRSECLRIMLDQGHPEPTGHAKVTPGYCLPAEFIIHTVGPQLGCGQTPSVTDRKYLSRCYRRCLAEAEKLPCLSDSRKVLAFCCISTGLFAFPGDLAAKIATKAVFGWLKENPSTTISDIIFNVFTDTDFDYYSDILHSPSLPRDLKQSFIQLEGESLETAVAWLKQADSLIISAGAGLSASDGLDYTSPQLFRAHFPAFLKLGLRRLYDVFGYRDWPSVEVEWGYYFTHLAMVRDWPASRVYASLLQLTRTFGDQHHVRTSNADGLFVANGFEDINMSTPQGQYKVLQCFKSCRPDATFPSRPYLDAALPHIDRKTQILTDTTKVPMCQYCGGRMAICVRGGNYFNEQPFVAGEQRWKRFLVESTTENKSTVILELGVGLSTAGVLRWPNEDIIQRYGERVKLIRVGIGPAGSVPWDLESEGNAIGVAGNIADVILNLVLSRA